MVIDHSPSLRRAKLTKAGAVPTPQARPSGAWAEELPAVQAVQGADGAGRTGQNWTRARDRTRHTTKKAKNRTTEPGFKSRTYLGQTTPVELVAGEPDRNKGPQQHGQRNSQSQTQPRGRTTARLGGQLRPAVSGWKGTVALEILKWVHMWPPFLLAVC